MLPGVWGLQAGAGRGAEDDRRGRVECLHAVIMHN